MLRSMHFQYMAWNQMKLGNFRRDHIVSVLRQVTFSNYYQFKDNF